MAEFEKRLHDMFGHIWECEIDHPIFQDTVGELMSAVIQCYNNLPSAKPYTDEYMVSAIAVEEMLKNLLPERGIWEIEGDEAKTAICETLHDALCGLWKLPFIKLNSKEMSFTHKALDTISRQKALDDIETVDPSMLLDVDWVKNWVKALPSAQPEQRWIPCSEETGDGYPEEDGFYYVTEQNYGFYLDADCKQRVTHTSHFKNGDFTDRFYTENISNITAWMPLPEPWKEGEADES